MVQALPMALAVGGKLVQGIGAMKSANANAAQLLAERRDTMREGAERELDLRGQARKAIGAQLAAQFSNGMQGGSGSALDALRESQVEAALDVLSIRRETSSRAAGLQQQAKNERRRGKFALVESFMGAASSAMGMNSDWGAANAGSGGGGGGSSSGSYGDGSNMTGGIRNY